MTANSFDALPPHVPPAKAARLLKVSRATLYLHLKRDCPRVGGRYYITPQWLESVAAGGLSHGL